MWDEEQQAWKLYFDYYNASLPGNCHMGLAECRGDFRTGRFDFVHSLDEPLLDNWPNPEVVKIGTGYYCFSDPPGYAPADKTPGRFEGWDSRQLRTAFSADGRHWEKGEFIPPDPGIAACPGAADLRLPPATANGGSTCSMPRRSVAGTTAVGTNGSAKGSTIGFTTRSAICGKRSNDKRRENVS